MYHNALLHTLNNVLQFALIYMFNLILGAGPLALPKAFSLAGILLGTLLLIFLAFMSFVTATFMIEAMASANAFVRHRMRMKSEKEKIVVHKSDSPSLQKDLEVHDCHTSCNQYFYHSKNPWDHDEY